MSHTRGNPAEFDVAVAAGRKAHGWGNHSASGATFFNRLIYIALVAVAIFNVSFAAKRVPRDLIIPLQLPNNPSLINKRAERPPVMDVFQVSPPVIVPAGVTSQCNQTLMVYTFANSYGKPFVGKELRE